MLNLNIKYKKVMNLIIAIEIVVQIRNYKKHKLKIFKI